MSALECPRRPGLLVAAVCLAPLLGCGRMLLGVADDVADAGADGAREAADAGTDGPPAKSPAIVSWEPKSADPGARITVVRVGDDFTYAGFSDGEIYYRATVGGATWTRMDKSDNIGGQLTPRMAVTAIAIDTLESSPSVFVGYAGETGAHTFWCAASNGQYWLEGPITDDVWSISVSPFDPSQLVIVTGSLTWASVGCGSSWSSSAPGTFPINFPGTVQSFAEGRAADGTRRAWVGDAAGGIYYSDDIDATPSTDAVWTPVPSAGLPALPITAISVNRDHPEQVWVTFRGLSATDIWATADNGATWTNQWRPELVMESDPSTPGTLTAVSIVAELDLAYVTALMPMPGGGATTVQSFWTVGRLQPWSPE